MLRKQGKADYTNDKIIWINTVAGGPGQSPRKNGGVENPMTLLPIVSTIQCDFII